MMAESNALGYDGPALRAEVKVVGISKSRTTADQGSK
jgi:hypothetical protein